MRLKPVEMNFFMLTSGSLSGSGKQAVSPIVRLDDFRRAAPEPVKMRVFDDPKLGPSLTCSDSLIKDFHFHHSPAYRLSSLLRGGIAVFTKEIIFIVAL